MVEQWNGATDFVLFAVAARWPATAAKTMRSIRSGHEYPIGVGLTQMAPGDTTCWVSAEMRVESSPCSRSTETCR